MANKEFKIQSDTVSLNGVPLSSSADGKVVIPGVTRATGYRVEEIEDTGDQTYQFTPDSEVVVLDAALYNAIVTAVDDTHFADFTAPTDGEGYIDGIEVNGRGTYSSAEATTAGDNDMYAYIGAGSASDRPIVPQDWIQIPFRPVMKSTGIESEFGAGGGSLTVEDGNTTVSSVNTLVLLQGGSVINLAPGVAGLDINGGGSSAGSFSTLPDFLDYVPGSTVHAGQTSNGLFFSGNGNSTTYPVRTNFSIAGTAKVVVSLDMVVNDECSDFSLCVFPEGTDPQFSWGNSPTRIAAQYNCTGPVIDGLEAGVESNWSIPGAGTYRVRFTYDPSSDTKCTLETLDFLGVVLDTITLDETLNTDNTYMIGFSADQDSTNLRTYIKNLTININNGQTVHTDTLMLSGGGGSAGDRLTNNGKEAVLDSTGVLTIPGELKVQYNGSNTISIGTGPGGGSVVGEDGKSFSVMLQSGANLSMWEFNTDSSTVLPGNVHASNVDITNPNVGWLVTQPARANSWGVQTAVDSNGNIYTLGGFYDWDWDGADRPMLIKYDKDGTRLWAKTFLDNDSNFGGTAYALTISNTDVIRITFSNWNDNNLVYTVTLDTDGDVTDYKQVNGVTSGYSFYPRGLASSGTDWIIAGELQQSKVFLTGNKQVLETGSTVGFSYWPKSFFTDPAHIPSGNTSWYITTTVSPGTVYEDFVYEVNKYYSVPLYNLFSNGVNADLYIQLGWDNSAVSFGLYSNTGTGYAQNDFIYTKGTDTGCLANIEPTAITGATWSYDGNISRNIFNTSADLGAVYANLQTQQPDIWNIIVPQIPGEYKINDITGSIGNWDLYITDSGNNDVGSLNLNTYDGRLIVYNATTGNSIIIRVTNGDWNYGGSAGNIMGLGEHWGLVNNARVKINTTGTTDFGVQFQQVIVNSVGNSMSNNYFLVNQTTYPRWNDIQVGWSWVDDAQHSGLIVSKTDLGNGTTQFFIDGGTADGSIVTVTSPTGKFQLGYSTNNNAVLLGTVDLSWGGEGDQRFNVAAYGPTGAIYAGGFYSNYGYCLLAKFVNGGIVWNKAFRNSNNNWDVDCHGIAVAQEGEGTEYIYVVGYDGNSDVNLYKFAGSDGTLQWSTLIGGYSSSNTNYRWVKAPAVQIASDGYIIVAGIGRTASSVNNHDQIQVLRFGTDGNMAGAYEVNHTNGFSSRYEGDENDFQFVIAPNDNGDDCIVMSAYYYDNNYNNDLCTTFKLPVATTPSFSSSYFSVVNTTAGWNSGAIATEYQSVDITTIEALKNLSDPLQPAWSGLSLVSSDVILSTNVWFINDSQSPSTVLGAAGGVGGQVTGVSEIAFADGSTQTSAYNPLMGYITTTNGWYMPVSSDAGKFLHCQNTQYIYLPGDDLTNYPIGWAITVMAPNWDVIFWTTWSGTPPTVIAVGKGQQANIYSSNTWKLKQYGMATVIKVAANTYWISGATIEAA